MNGFQERRRASGTRAVAQTEERGMADLPRIVLEPLARELRERARFDLHAERLLRVERRVILLASLRDGLEERRTRMLGGGRAAGGEEDGQKKTEAHHRSPDRADGSAMKRNVD